MRSSTFDWGRVIQPLRWTARALGFIYAILFLVVSSGFGNTATQDVIWVALFGAIVIGLLIATFRPGVGELAGGLLIIGGALWLIAVYSGLQWGALAAIAPFLITGALFLVCGWYKMARENPSLPV
jgi:hypothetical protein